MLNGYKLIIGALCVLLALIGIAKYFPTHWDLSGREKENLRDICPSHDAGGYAKNVLCRGPRHRRPPCSDHAAGHRCVCVADDTGKLPEPDGILVGGSHRSCRAFIAVLFGFVGLAYYLGGRQILKCDLVEVLQSDYM